MQRDPRRLVVGRGPGQLYTFTEAEAEAFCIVTRRCGLPACAVIEKLICVPERAAGVPTRQRFRGER